MNFSRGIVVVYLLNVSASKKTKSQIAWKILIAVQDLRMADLIHEYLLRSGHKAICESNLDTVLQTLSGAHINLLIVDGEMPEKVLRNFVEAVARVKPGLPVIAVGMSEHETQSRTLSAFVSAFIEKPFSIADISNTIKEVQAQFPVGSFGNASLKLN
ncbi:MAG TPA: response regulator [Candidatus Acidoferrales bacterium]|nr:response regulator [Candidatus Acidoferrales bacterium]